MKIFKVYYLLMFVLVLTATGCASYRTSSNTELAAPPVTIGATEQVTITEGTLEGQEYDELGLIEVSVKKLTVFHKDPTKEQANQALIEKATAMGANAVINVSYKSGVGMTTWGYMDAKGTGVKLK